MKKNNLLKFIILAALLVFILNPGLNPLLSEGTKNAVSAELQANFGMLAGGYYGVFTPAKLLTILAVIIFVWLVTTAVCFVMNKLSANNRHSQTVAGMMESVVKVIGAVFGLSWSLNIIGIDLAAIFASLGIVALIVGFGVQSLIEDCVTGLFIILEGVYNIGDVIVLDTFRGTVQKVSLRTTTLIDTAGNLKIINNSDIRNVQNRSANLSLAICDVGTSYDADIRQIEAVIKGSLEKMYENNKDLFEAVPIYYGVQRLADSCVVVRVGVNVKEENFFAAQRRLNREIKILFDENGIEIPFNQLVVHNG